MAHLAARASRRGASSGVDEVDPLPDARGGRAGVTLLASCGAGSTWDAATASMTAPRSGAVLFAFCAGPPAGPRWECPGLPAGESAEDEACQRHSQDSQIVQLCSYAAARSLA